jgi:DNA-binding transcriptional MerR regulator
MSWNIPGTVLTAAEKDGAQVESQFRAMFLPGGMVLSQVSAITGLESYTIQNWVKRGFLTKPVNKHYSLRQLCRIINVNMLKGVLPLPDICSLLGYVNGQLDNEADDMIDDSDLYFMFVRLATRSKELYRAESRDTVLDEELAAYEEPVPGAREKVKAVLRIMLTAWLATRMAQETENMLKELEKEDLEYVH